MPIAPALLPNKWPMALTSLDENGLTGMTLAFYFRWNDEAVMQKSLIYNNDTTSYKKRRSKAL